MIGASATGRDSIINCLVQSGGYRHLISNTTRPKRRNNGIQEQNGVEYWFKTEAEMLDDLLNHKMLEAEIIHDQQVSGISLAELAKANQLHKVAITNVEFNIRSIVAAKPDTLAIMVLPPSFREVLKRLQNRGNLSAPEINRRLQTAIKIYQVGLDWPIFDYVINDQLENAAKQIEAIVLGQQSPKDHAQALLRQLIDDGKRWLQSPNNNLI